MQTLASIITDFALANNANYAKIQARILEAAASANNNIEPTLDCHGRMHAPCDGYNWEDVVYAGGSYLPTPIEWLEMIEVMGGTLKTFDSSKYESRSKIKGDLALFNDVVKACKLNKVDAKVTHGTVWDGDQCYIYVSSKKAKLIELIEVYADEVKAQYYAELKKDKGIAPIGKQTIRGIVLSIKEYIGEWGITYKACIELDNKATVFGSLPRVFDEKEIRGKTIQFTANFEQAENDKTHSFYKRPSKPTLV